MDPARARRETRTCAGPGHELQQFQYLLDGDLAAELLQIDSRHGSPASMENA